jgi:multiple sugar transport system substrate-binding protein
VGLGATVLLAGCGNTSAAGSSSSSKTVTLTFDAMQYSAASNTYFPEFVKEFEAAHPNIHVHLRVINWSSGHQVLNTEIGGGNAPNVAIIGTRWLPSYVNNNLLMPLSS